MTSQFISIESQSNSTNNKYHPSVSSVLERPFSLHVLFFPTFPVDQVRQESRQYMTNLFGNVTNNVWERMQILWRCCALHILRGVSECMRFVPIASVVKYNYQTLASGTSKIYGYWQGSKVDGSGYDAINVKPNITHRVGWFHVLVGFMSTSNSMDLLH